MENIYNLTIEELEKKLKENNFKKYRATQIYEAIYKRNIKNFNKINNIKKELTYFLENNFEFNNLKIVQKQEEKDVKKYLIQLQDKLEIEAVLMKQKYGNSLCISTQVGCNMNCRFCESGKTKKIRNLETFEMVNQILLIEEDLEERISHIVLMGIGEPLDNYDNVINFIKIINNDKGLKIGARHITISTCGIIPKIEKLENLDLQINLAVSLHASNDKIRSELMPINKVYNINNLITTLKKYIKKTNRRITFEYILINDLNDKKENAIELSRLLNKMNCHVNLIPYNETSSINLKKSTKENVENFKNILLENKINCTIRKEFGSKVDAACGQLRAKNKGEKK